MDACLDDTAEVSSKTNVPFHQQCLSFPMFYIFTNPLLILLNLIWTVLVAVWYSLCDFNFISLMDRISFFMPVGHLVSIFCPLFKKWDLFFFFLAICRKSIYILNLGPLLGVCIPSTFSQSVLPLHYLNVFRWTKKSSELLVGFGQKRALQMIFSGKKLLYSIWYGKMLKLSIQVENRLVENKGVISRIDKYRKSYGVL